MGGSPVDQRPNRWALVCAARRGPGPSSRVFSCPHGLHSSGGAGIMLYLMTQLSVLRAQFAARERGQGMVEYGLIIAAVAIAVIIALFALGPKIGSIFSSTAASLQ